MNARPGGPLPAAAWLGVPVLACLIATMLFAIPLRAFGLQPPEPVFALVPAFAWGLIRPSIWPSVALVLLGLSLDLLWGGPVGLWPIALLAAYAAVFLTRGMLTGQDFWPLWAAYAASCAIAMGVALILADIRAGHLPSLVGAALQWAASAALFPFAWRLVERYEDADVRFR